MREVALGDICELVNGRAFKPSDWSDVGLPIVRIQNLNNEDAPFNRYSGEVRERFLIDSGALLFSWSGTPGTSFGAFFWNRGPAILNQHIFHVRPVGSVDKNYLRYALNGRIDRIISQAHGGVGLQHITKDKLEATLIPLPPLAEQRRIADILDKADTIRRKRKEAIALTQELLRSTFLEMFGDPVTNPKGWPVTKMGDLVEIRGGGTPPRSRPELFRGSIPWASAKDFDSDVMSKTEEYVTDEAVRISSTKLVPPSTILVVVKSKVLMRRLPVAITTVPLCFNQDVKGLVAHRIDEAPFLAAYLRATQRKLLERARGANTEGLTLEHLRNHLVFQPPRSAVLRYSTLDAKLRNHLQTLAKWEAVSATLFDSLVARAFAGGLESPR